MQRVMIGAQCHGELYRVKGELRWLRQSTTHDGRIINNGIETFRKGTKPDDLKPYIARLCRVDVSTIKYVKS